MVGEPQISLNLNADFFRIYSVVGSNPILFFYCLIGLKSYGKVTGRIAHGWILSVLEFYGGGSACWHVFIPSILSPLICGLPFQLYLAKICEKHIEDTRGI